jgi:hypothetical protein
MGLYDVDFAAWSQSQADALRRKAWDKIDIVNVAEEIESLGRSDRREIGSRLEILLLHLLKWQYQPRQQRPSWRASIDEARERISQLLEESPSLKPYPAERLAKAYPQARRKALRETSLPNLPEACPWPIEQVLDLDFMP